MSKSRTAVGRGEAYFMRPTGRMGSVVRGLTTTSPDDVGRASQRRRCCPRRSSAERPRPRVDGAGAATVAGARTAIYVRPSGSPPMRMAVAAGRGLSAQTAAAGVPGWSFAHDHADELFGFCCSSTCFGCALVCFRRGRAGERISDGANKGSPLPSGRSGANRCVVVVRRCRSDVCLRPICTGFCGWCRTSISSVRLMLVRTGGLARHRGQR